MKLRLVAVRQPADPSGTARVVDSTDSRLYRRRNPSLPSKEPLITGPEEDYQDTNFIAKRLSPCWQNTWRKNVKPERTVMSPATPADSRFHGRLGCGKRLHFDARYWGLCTALYRVVILILISLAGSAAAGSTDSAPPSSDRPWSAPGIAEHQADLQSRHLEIGSNAEVDPRKVYELPDLVDLAQRLNPETKISWQRAKEALAAVGLKEVTYYPLLSAAAAAGYTRLFAPLPSLSINRAALVRAIQTGGSASSAISLQDSGNSLHLDILAQTTLSVKWLLFDFGERAAAVRSAREELLIANVAFNATHQKLVFDVSRNYYVYNTQRDAVRVAQSSLETANTVHEAVEARFQNGLATKPEVLQATQQLAQSQFDLQKALGAQTDSRVDLLISIGLRPSVKIQIADNFVGSLPTNIQAPVSELVEHALVQRPDMIAALANIRSKEARINEIRASNYPKVSAVGGVGYGEERLSLGRNNTFDSGAPTFGGGVAVEVPVFDGFLRRRELSAAQSALEEANSQLQKNSDQTVREVWQAYTDLHTAITSEAAAGALVKASQEAYDAVLTSYKQGFSTYTEIVTNETKLTSARNALFQTRSAIHTAATALALSLGDLAQPDSSQTVTRIRR